MADWHPIQKSFSGGIISPRMLNRDDVDAWGQSVLNMVNFMPTLQGSAQRTPGTRYLYEIPDHGIHRVIPFQDVTGAWAILQLSDESFDVKGGVIEAVEGRAVGAPAAQATVPFSQQIIDNWDFRYNLAGWNFFPAWEQYPSVSFMGVTHIVFDGDGAAKITVVKWNKSPFAPSLGYIRRSGLVTQPTDSIRVEFFARYNANPGELGETKTAEIRLGYTEGASDIGVIDLSDLPLGGSAGGAQPEYFDLSPGYTGDIWIEFYLEATEDASTPDFSVDYLQVYANGLIPDIEDAPIDNQIPAGELWKEEDLLGIQYVQMVNGNKELVLVHPNYPPRWLYFDSNAMPAKYVLQDIPFEEDTGSGRNPYTPPTWGVGNYPGSATSFQARLYLGGSGYNSEQIIGSASFDPVLIKTANSTTDPVTPSDALQLETVYRSPIAWMFGHKQLLVGAQELEYAITASTSTFNGDSGPITAGDFEAYVQSTHGGRGIQPVGVGQFVAFASDQGQRLRAMQANRDNEGWLAPDLTLLSPNILQPGVTRINKMRNPHQMILCTLANGNLAILHQDTYAGLAGWSILSVSGIIIDCCVIPGQGGIDILFMVVNRQINGENRSYVEAITDWTQDGNWNYLNSYKEYQFTEPTALLTGLEHLEGEAVYVVANQTALGQYTVENGEIDLVDKLGYPILVGSAVVGKSFQSVVATLPPSVSSQYGSLNAQLSFSEIQVRCYRSSRPIINGQRPPDRDPITPMGVAERPDFFRDNVVVNLGWDKLATITIEENLPVRCEVLSISGKLSVEEL